MRAIDGDALEELFREVISGIAKKPEMNGNLEHMVRASAMVIEMIQDAPTIEPERKRGWWIIKETAYEDTEAKCSCCGFETLVDQPGNGLHMVNDLHYCPHCGADMRGEQDDFE